MKQIESHSREETQLLGRKLAHLLKPGDVVILTGDLGSGKTELVRGFMRELDPNAIVRSPSFSLVNSYPTTRFMVNHFDFYRLSAADELFEVGYDEYLSADSICFIEWGEMFPEAIPGNCYHMIFTEASENHRVIKTDLPL